MAMMNPLIPLSGQLPDIAGSYARGVEAGQAVLDARQRNALAATLQQHGPGIMAGDPQALNALAQHDPSAALGIQAGREQMGQRQRADARDAERLSMARQQAARQAAEHAAKLSDIERQREAEQTQRLVSGLRMLHEQGPEAWAAGLHRFADDLPEGWTDLDYADAPIAIELATGAWEGLGGERFGLNPQYATDPQGNLVPFQVGDRGTARPLQLPDGLTPGSPIERIDLGDRIRIVRRSDGQILGEEMKGGSPSADQRPAEGGGLEPIPGSTLDVTRRQAGAERAGVIAAVDDKAQQMLDLVESIRDDPALESITGMVRGRLPPLSQAGTNLNTKIENLQGKVFLEAFESLKGGGQISNAEGQAAERAMARLQRAQDAEAYRDALDDLKLIIQRGIERRNRGERVPDAPPPADPGVDALPGISDDDLLRMYGG